MQVNLYRCPVKDGGCGHEWIEVWDCGCDSECPECGLSNIQCLDSVPQADLFAEVKDSD